MGKRCPSYLLRLTNLQKRSWKFILGNNTFSNNIYSIMSLENVRKYFCSTKFYKCYCMGSDQWLTIKLSKLHPNHNYTTHHKANNDHNILEDHFSSLFQVKFGIQYPFVLENRLLFIISSRYIGNILFQHSKLLKSTYVLNIFCNVYHEIWYLIVNLYIEP